MANIGALLLLLLLIARFAEAGQPAKIVSVDNFPICDADPPVAVDICGVPSVDVLTTKNIPLWIRQAEDEMKVRAKVESTSTDALWIRQADEQMKVEANVISGTDRPLWIRQVEDEMKVRANVNSGTSNPLWISPAGGFMHVRANVTTSSTAPVWVKQTDPLPTCDPNIVHTPVAVEFCNVPEVNANIVSQAEPLEVKQAEPLDVQVDLPTCSAASPVAVEFCEIPEVKVKQSQPPLEVNANVKAEENFPLWTRIKQFIDETLDVNVKASATFPVWTRIKQFVGETLDVSIKQIPGEKLDVTYPTCSNPQSTPPVSVKFCYDDEPTVKVINPTAAHTLKVEQVEGAEIAVSPVAGKPLLVTQVDPGMQRYEWSGESAWYTTSTYGTNPLKHQSEQVGTAPAHPGDRLILEHITIEITDEDRGGGNEPDEVDMKAHLVVYTGSEDYPVELFIPLHKSTWGNSKQVWTASESLHAYSDAIPVFHIDYYLWDDSDDHSTQFKVSLAGFVIFAPV